MLKRGIVKIPVYTGVGYGIRDVLMLRTVDAVVSLAGGAGTLNELANAYHLYKPIITLKNSGGWTEKLEDTYIDSRKKMKIISCNTLDELIQTLLYEMNKVRRFKYINKKMLYEVDRV